MAANRFLLQLVAFSALAFAAIRPVSAAEVDCSIRVWKVPQSSHAYYRKMAEYACTPQLYGVNMFTVLTLEWNNCPLNDTDPANACMPVDPAPLDGRNHVAVVPTCEPRQGSDCSLEEKAKNLGQANYVAFITWYDYNCSNSFDQQIESSANKSAIPVSVDQGDGHELLLYADNPDYVVDVYIQYSDIVTLAGLVMASGTLCCLCCCLFYFSGRLCCRSSRSSHRSQSYSLSRRALNRMAVKCTYKMGQGMNDTCSICLEEFTEGEKIRELPCLHLYHGGCVEKWLNQYKHTCPLCKTPITARRKKREAASKSERAPLLAAADLESSVSYSALQDEEKGNGDGDHDNAHVTTTAVTSGSDVEVGVNYGALLH